jgi:hypothetical protein
MVLRTTQSFNGILTSNVARLDFTIPNLPEIDLDSDLNVFASVSEPTSKRRSRDSFCEATTVLVE